MQIVCIFKSYIAYIAYIAYAFSNLVNFNFIRYFCPAEAEAEALQPPPVGQKPHEFLFLADDASPLEFLKVSVCLSLVRGGGRRRQLGV